MSCRALFEKLPTERGEVSKRADIIDRAFPNAYCECESVSEFSEGTISGAEYVHRFVFSPIHIHEGEVLPALFHDAKDKGLSCERGSSEQADSPTHERGRQQIEGWNASRAEGAISRSYVGSVSASCSVLRALTMNDNRLLAIYDTALVDNPHHCDVFEIAGRTRAERKQARKDIADAFSKVPVDR